MSWNYVVTAHKPTNVTHSLTGNFTGPDEINLIVSKCTLIEVHRVDAEGLHCMKVVPLYGRVATMELWRPAGARQDMLFISTERYQFCILAYNAATDEIETRAKGDVQDRIGRPADSGQIAVVDPQCRLIGLHLYDGLFKVRRLRGYIRYGLFKVPSPSWWWPPVEGCTDAHTPSPPKLPIFARPARARPWLPSTPTRTVALTRTRPGDAHHAITPSRHHVITPSHHHATR